MLDKAKKQIQRDRSSLNKMLLRFLYILKDIQLLKFKATYIKDKRS